MNKAPVNNIIHHSLVDGPGNRTSIFLQGCNIKCRYCHNPERQKILAYEQEMDFIKWLSPEEVFLEVEKDIPFIRGITVSGGECMIYPNFMRELFKLCKANNLNTLIDTNGTIDFRLHEDLLSYTDGVMIDIKSWDKEVFKALTLSDNSIMQHNLKYLADKNKIEEIRIVYIPNKVDIYNILDQIKVVIKDKIESIPLKLIKYRSHGVIDEEFKLIKSPTDDEMKQIKDYALNLGYRNFR